MIHQAHHKLQTNFTAQHNGQDVCSDTQKEDFGKKSTTTYTKHNTDSERVGAQRRQSWWLGD
jgi:hypothetical protein